MFSKGDESTSQAYKSDLEYLEDNFEVKMMTLLGGVARLSGCGLN